MTQPSQVIAAGAPVPTMGRRHRSRLLAAGPIVLLVALVVGYIGLGYLIAQDHLQKAEQAYASAHDHQLGMFANHRALNEQARAMDFSKATVANYQTFKTISDQIVAQAKQAQKQIGTDDAALASAQHELHQDRWITALSRDRLDREATRIRYMRRALADATTMNDDYVQMGTFLDAFTDAMVDWLTISDKADASDFAGAAVATAQLKSDVDKAALLDKAAALPPDVQTLLGLIGSVATDYTKLLNAYANNDSNAYDSADAALQTDESRLNSFDYVGFVSEIDAHYAALDTAYEADIQKANSAHT